eukprot:8525796-Pyramimonas_sp.AAC.1
MDDGLEDCLQSALEATFAARSRSNLEMLQAMKDIRESARQNRELKKAAFDLTCRVGYLEMVAKACLPGH